MVMIVFHDLHDEGGHKVVLLTEEEAAEVKHALGVQELVNAAEYDLVDRNKDLVWRLYDKPEFTGYPVAIDAVIIVPIY